MADKGHTKSSLQSAVVI